MKFSLILPKKARKASRRMLAFACLYLLIGIAFFTLPFYNLQRIRQVLINKEE